MSGQDNQADKSEQPHVLTGYYMRGARSPATISVSLIDRSNLFNCIQSFIQAMSIAPLQVHYYSEALPTQQGNCA